VNVVRAIAPPSVYAAVVQMASGGEQTLVAQNSAARRFVSVQVETAWGRLPDAGHFVGIDKERADFPYIKALGLSSYPFLGGFSNPNDVPIDYYARLGSSSGHHAADPGCRRRVVIGFGARRNIIARAAGAMDQAVLAVRWPRESLADAGSQWVWGVTLILTAGPRSAG
jgi:hypothetical protein